MKNYFSRLMAASWFVLLLALSSIFVSPSASAEVFPTQYEALQACLARKAYLDEHVDDIHPEWRNAWKQVCEWYPEEGQTHHGYFNKWYQSGQIYDDYEWFNYGYEYAECAPPGIPQPGGSCQAPPPSVVTSLVQNEDGGFTCPSVNEKSSLLTLLCGNPINSATGNKLQVETDFAAQGLLEFVRYYNSSSTFVHALGKNWSHTYARYIKYSGPNSALRMRGDGQVTSFTYANNIWTSAAHRESSLQRLTDGSGNPSGWVYQARDGREVENYDALGRLTSVVRTDGQSATLVYNYGLIQDGPEDYLLTSVEAQDGRRLEFTYNVYNQLTQLKDAAGAITTYSYDVSNRLTSVTYSGGASKTYLYNEAAYIAGADAEMTLLTGIQDELNHRFATFNYQTDGKAISTEHAGGVEKFSVAYGLGSNTVTPPGGAVQTRTFVSTAGMARSSSTSMTVGGVARNYGYTYDANGFADVLTDPLQTTTDYDYDANGRATQVVESANVASSKRTTQTDWHASFDVPTERRLLNAAGILESKNTWTYNTRGQVLTATQVNLANGSLSRTTSYTYCEAADVSANTCPRMGLLRSVDGPLSSTPNDLTTFTYYADDDSTCVSAPATCPHRKGDLWKVTNALSQVTETLAYDGAGRPLSIKDPNGVVTDLEYSPRGWLTARKVRGLQAGTEVDDSIIRLEYNNTGSVTKVTQPDGSFLDFGYDYAQRLTDVTDTLGNTIHYTLDSQGNRVKDETKDSGGQLKRLLPRTFNALGELQTLANSQFYPVSDFTYDAAGNIDTTTEHPTSSSTRLTDHDFDALGRLKQVIANVGGGASDKATSQFQYDARDNVRTVVDPKGLSTTYNYDSLGNLTDRLSPDTGSTIYSYDPAGNQIAELKADNVTQGYTYDALGRLTARTFAHAAQNMTYTYDVTQSDCAAGEGYSVGRLTKIQDASGSTRFCYDARGNRVRVAQTVVTGSTFTGTTTATVLTGISYDAANRIQAISYTSGTNTAVVTYQRNLNGQINRIDVKPTATSPQVPLVSAVTYLPFGPIETITFGNGRVLSKTYDQDYAPDLISDSASSNPLSLDLSVNSIGNITGLTERTSATTTVSRTYQYDGLDRLTAQKNGATAVEGFTYDATGNRLSKTFNSVTDTYGYDPSSHRLTSINGQARSYNAVGDLTSGEKVGANYRYDDAHRLAKLSSAKDPQYNAFGQRVGKLAGTLAGSTMFVYDEVGHLVGEYNGNGVVQKQYVWLDDTLVGVISSFDGSSYQFVETDHLGTPRAVVHPSKNVIVWRWDLNPTAFGEHAAAKNPDGDALNYDFNLRFPGQYYDSENGLFYNYFRDYEPSIGRYIESDPIGLKGGVSTYSYVLARPLNSTDRLGLDGGGLYTDPNLRLPTPQPVGGNFAGGVMDFFKTFGQMWWATHVVGREFGGWANQDKYFHCLANCRAASRGPGGVIAASCVSNFREFADQNLKGDSAADSEADMAANAFGRIGGFNSPTIACQVTCGSYRPGGSFPY